MRLALLAGVAGLIVIAAPRRVEPPKPFWIITPTCERCDLEQIARSRAASDSLECPIDLTKISSEHWRSTEQCVRERWAQHVPFVAVESLQGVDSRIAAAFYSRADGGVSQLWYDSDVGGGLASCRAVVTVRNCKGLSDAGDAYDLCAAAGTADPACDENPSRVLRVERGGDVNDLWCVVEPEDARAPPDPRADRGAEFPLCARSQDLIRAIEKEPSLDVRRVDSELFCTPWGERFSGALSCTADRRWRPRLWLIRADPLVPVDAPIPDGK